MKKVYIITVEETIDQLKVHRRNIGFCPYELLGILEDIQLDIHLRLEGKKPADHVREVTIVHQGRQRYEVLEPIVLTFLTAQDAHDVKIGPPNTFIESDGKSIFYDGHESTTTHNAIDKWLALNIIKKEG